MHSNVTNAVRTQSLHRAVLLVDATVSAVVDAMEQ